MSRTNLSKGACGYCRREMTCSGLGRHLRSCPERRKSIERANGRSGSNELLHHLQVRDGYGLGYWLHLEMDGSATLFDLDHYLRHIWLECCGHMSAFKIEGVQYLDTLGDSFGFEESESLDAQAHQLFTPGLNFAYEYDFGTTTELSIRVLDQRGGKPSTTHGLALMARNAPVQVPCEQCGKSAQLICLDCCYDSVGHGAGYVCRDHAGSHATHDDYGGMMGIFNSPRSGVCGYDGPAEPPYRE